MDSSIFTFNNSLGTKSNETRDTKLRIHTHTHTHTHTYIYDLDSVFSPEKFTCYKN